MSFHTSLSIIIAFLLYYECEMSVNAMCKIRFSLDFFFAQITYQKVFQDEHSAIIACNFRQMHTLLCLDNYRGI